MGKPQKKERSSITKKTRNLSPSKPAGTYLVQQLEDGQWNEGELVTGRRKLISKELQTKEGTFKIRAA